MKTGTGILIFLMALSTALAQPIGVVDTAGYTWYDLQHNGSCGRMIAVDAMGYAHVVWTNGTNNWQRHVYYNVWDPNTHEFMFDQTGCQMDASLRAGFATLIVLPGGIAIPAFHQTVTGDSAHAGAAIDFSPRTCAFTFSQPTSQNGVQHYWPKISMTPDSDLHMVTIQPSGAGGGPNAIFYSRGILDDSSWEISIDWQDVQFGDEFMFVDSCMTISADVAASRNSNRVVIGWAHPRRNLIDDTLSSLNNDAMIRISGDGGLMWGPNINITEFVPPDTDCVSGDTLYCNRDTFRVYTDMSLLFDEEGNIHAAFTVRTFFELGYPEYGPEPRSWVGISGIYYWNELEGWPFQECSLIAPGFDYLTQDGALLELGVWQTNVQRPSLSIDTTTGYLYCSYMKYDSTCTSEDDYAMADVFISVSTNGGADWSVGTNVTRSCPGENIPAPGSRHERDQTLAETVTDGILHLFYELDYDAGSMVQQEGVATLNDMLYQRIPVDSIATSPLVPYYPLHVDEDVAEERRENLLPNNVQLHPAYPNPFNSSTIIKFDLSQRMKVELKIYDLLGQEVMTLAIGTYEAGAHRLTLSADKLSSGIYFLHLQTPSTIRTQKLLLLK